jgi:glycosyltransferase involved in cell wall biosynthesis
MSTPSRADTTKAQDGPMRIMLISQFYPPVIGGVEVHVQALARGLVKRGHEVVVATHVADGNPAGDRLDEGVRVRSLQGMVQRIGPLFTTERRHAIPLADPGLKSGLKQLASEFRPDIVHAHNWLGRSYVPIKRTIGVPYLVSLHDSGRICTQGRMMYRGQELCTGPSVQRCLSCCAVQFGAVKGSVTYLGNRVARSSEARAVDLFLPVSNAVARSNHLAQDRLPFSVVPNFAADAEPLSSCTDPRLAQLPAEPFVLQVGDVVADKGVDVLFEAYRRMDSPPPLVLIGRIAETTATSLPPGVIAVGPWPHELVLEAWRRSLLGTMPSLCLDACPTVTFEAMAARKPVVVSALGGLLDQVVDGETGLLVPPGDSSALASAIRRLAGDAELRASMGIAARARFDSEFRSDVVIDRIESIYHAQVQRPSA